MPQRGKRSGNGNVGLIGCGDIVKKAAPSIRRMQALGHKVVAVDFRDDPVGLEYVTPDRLFNLGNAKAHAEFV
jgi:phosphoglycerate dehydrogenase-like enzyme